MLLQKVKHIHASTGRNEIKVLVYASVGICDIAFRKQLRIDIKAAALHIALAGHIGCGQGKYAGGGKEQRLVIGRHKAVRSDCSVSCDYISGLKGKGLHAVAEIIGLRYRGAGANIHRAGGTALVGRYPVAHDGITYNALAVLAQYRIG